MTKVSEHPEPSNAKRWTGYILAALPVLLMTMSAVMKITRQPMVVEGFAKGGIPVTFVVAIGAAELLCVLLFLIPATSILGAVLTTGYLGGAVMVHVRAHEIQGLIPFLLGVMAWGSLYLREPRLRDLLPLRTRRLSHSPDRVTSDYAAIRTTTESSLT